MHSNNKKLPKQCLDYRIYVNAFISLSNCPTNACKVFGNICVDINQQFVNSKQKSCAADSASLFLFNKKSQILCLLRGIIAPSMITFVYLCTAQELPGKKLVQVAKHSLILGSTVHHNMTHSYRFRVEGFNLTVIAHTA